jgi:hypothetical protein
MFLLKIEFSVNLLEDDSWVSGTLLRLRPVSYYSLPLTQIAFDFWIESVTIKK